MRITEEDDRNMYSILTVRNLALEGVVVLQR